MATACSRFVAQSRCFSPSAHHRLVEASQTSTSSTYFGTPFSNETLQKSPPSKSVRQTLSVQARGRRRDNAGVGFGPRPKVTKKPRKQQLEDDPFRLTPVADTKTEEDGYASEGDDTVPEVVTNRMLARMGFTVGIPLVLGLTFFPMFWYLKVIKHLDIPNWVPYFVSIFTFGAAAAGISYGILSVSWNPSQEGSALGWKEAQANWPVFWELLRNGGNSKGKR